ncbi:MAG: ATP-dependent RecD-like DNA helicase [Oscillospiraceae bacterium]|nr:ATP-dependent RecD-like DNA helicase [Oscillospiraceae bacterium]
MRAEKELETLIGVVEAVTYSNPQNGYVILDLDKGGDYVTVVGELGNIEAGEELTLRGEYATHPKFGVQFKAVLCERTMPATEASIQKYLSSGVIKGVGAALAKRIVEKFGDKSLEVIENEPELLADIKGVTKKKADEIALEFKRIFGIRALMIFLSQYNVRPSVAVGAWKRWGRYAVDIIKENPYALCENGIELEFEKAENIAKMLEIPHDCENRIKAGIRCVLLRNAQNGHTCLPYDRLKEKALLLLGVAPERFDEALKNECSENHFNIYCKSGRDFVFLSDYFIAEQYITDRLSAMNSCFKASESDYAPLIDIEEKTKDITYAAAQRKAIALALSQGFIILTGGPGTGKTTALKAIISLYEQSGLKVMLAAPTGKASKRVSDLTGYNAKTIHRLLEVIFDKNGKPRFKHNENHPLSCDVIIIDEMSMVDSLLFESLLRALKLSCRLIMVGDSDQLPSVGAGNVLKDMLDSGGLTVVHLSEIFRQARQSCIVTNAHAIVNGIPPDLSRSDNDFFFLQRLSQSKASDTVVDLIKNRLPSAYGYSPYDDIQALCPSRKGTLGVYEMNKAIQEAINPPALTKSEVKGLFGTYRVHDKVMQIKNNYDIEWSKDGETGTGIYNGDIGMITKVNRSEGKLVIDFDGRTCEYPFEMLEQLELAYAITVHKSQGSEFNAVILPLLGGFDKLYYRNLLYTAVTRAKKLLIIVGSKNVVCAMVANNRRTLRYTCLKDMLEKAIGSGSALECAGGSDEE